MSELNVVVDGAEFSCGGSEDFIRSEREAFYRVMCGAKMERPSIKESPIDVSSCVLMQSSSMAADLAEILKGVKSDTISLHCSDVLRCLMNDGNVMGFIVTDMDADRIRFESVECLPVGVSHKGIEDYLESFWRNIPAALQDAIIPVERKCFARDGSLVTESKWLFLPSASEVFPEDDCYGDKGLYSQMAWYKDRRHRIRNLGESDDPCVWWLSSVYNGTTTNYFCSVGSNGNAVSNNANGANGVAPGFCISKS